MRSLEVYDSLYGEVRFEGALRKLIFTPAVQRLRHVRLSNVDSMSLPGFAGPTRYEHALGAADVAAHLGFFGTLTAEERTTLQAAAVIHDTAITPYGHLIEEAFAYVGRPFDHERKWEQLSDEEYSADPGGAQSQIYLGYESGFRSWAEAVFGRGSWRAPLASIMAAVRGAGPYGRVIAGELDVDNIDNVTRAAFHMGISCERELPRRLAGSIRGVEGTRPVVDKRDVGLISCWLDLRRAVYSKLMLAEMDYSGKAMLVAAATAACEDGLITADDWRLTDPEFTQLLLSSGSERAKGPLRQWLLGDLWPLSDMVWMKGRVPTLSEVYRFSQELSEEIGRCMAYRIKDKETSQGFGTPHKRRHDLQLGRRRRTGCSRVAVSQQRVIGEGKGENTVGGAGGVRGRGDRTRTRRWE